MRQWGLLLCLGLMMMGQQTSSAASSVAQVDPRVSSRPMPLLRQPVVVEQLAAEAHQDGPLVKVALSVTLRNHTPSEQGYELLLPLGGDAVASGFDLKVDGKALEGQVLTAAKAREIYQQLTRRLRDPGLLEHYGDSLFRASIFPVPANGTVTATLNYTTLTGIEGDLAMVRIPLTAFRNGGVPIAKASVKGSVSSDHPITSLYSPSMPITSLGSKQEGTRHRATFQWSADGFRADSDFSVFSRARGEAALCDAIILSERPDPKEDGYFLAALHGVPQPHSEPEPRDVVFVLDKSGSMQGDKIEQAKKALQFMVERLRPTDRFNMVIYSNTVQLFQEGLQLAKPEIIRAAVAHIGTITAEGGTNIEGALASGLGLFADSPSVHQMVFLTDGLPTVGERDRHKLCQQALAANKHQVRLVAFGVGFDVNAMFLDSIAVQNHGLSEYVLPGENIEERVPGFYQRMQNPLVTDAVVSFEGANIHDTYPRQVGDLYEGERMLLVGRYRLPTAGTEEKPVGTGPASKAAKLIVSGKRRGESVRYEFNMNLAAAARAGEQEMVARMWAAKKVGFLVDEIRLNGQNQELVDSIVKIGTRFGILTEYTSFLAAEETDLLAFGENGLRAGVELHEKGRVESGGSGVAQAVNSKKAQREQSLDSTANTWVGADGRNVEVQSVQCVNGSSLWNRNGAWVDATIPKDAKIEVVELFSDAFFALLDRNPWLNRIVARTGDVTCRVDTRYIRFNQKTAGN